MIPFLVEVLENLLRTLLAKFVKKDVLQTLKLIKIDISDKKVQKSLGDLDSGFSIKHDLKQLALQKRVTDSKKRLSVF